MCYFINIFWISASRQQSQDDESNVQNAETNIHHQYFTVAIGFLKDIISQASVVCVLKNSIFLACMAYFHKSGPTKF